MDMRSLCVSTVSVIRLDVFVFICSVVACVILCVDAVVFIADANFVFSHVIVTIVLFSVSFLTEEIRRTQHLATHITKQVKNPSRAKCD